MEAKLKEQKDSLGEEKTRVSECVTEGIDALALDDAWFIQAYPDIDLEGGSTVITQTRDMLAAKVGGWSVDFNPELRGNAKFQGSVIPAVQSHGQVTSSGNGLVDNYFSPRSASSPPAIEGPVADGDLSVDSIIEAQVQTMMKCVK